jgi:hypothetical protein
MMRKALATGAAVGLMGAFGITAAPAQPVASVSA